MRDSTLSFWSEETLTFVKRINLKKKVRQLVIDKSCRFFATLTENGSVDVWKLTGHEAKPFWSLEFESVKQIEANNFTEN